MRCYQQPADGSRLESLRLIAIARMDANAVANPPDGATEFRLLGPVEVVRGGHVVPLGGRRQRALLALLLLDVGRPVSSDRLIDQLWQGDAPRGAGKTLRAYVSRLRSALGDEAVVARPTG